MGKESDLWLYLLCDKIVVIDGSVEDSENTTHLIV